MKKFFGAYFVAQPFCWLFMVAIADIHDWRTAFAMFGIGTMVVLTLIGGFVLFDSK